MVAVGDVGADRVGLRGRGVQQSRSPRNYGSPMTPSPSDRCVVNGRCLHPDPDGVFVVCRTTKCTGAIAWRELSWPVSGLVTSAPLHRIPAVILTVAALVVAVSGGPGIARQFGRWAAATTLWSVIALSLVAPNLVVIAAGLPNDEYHAWLDSILLAVIGVAVSRLWTATATRVGRAAAIAIVVACLVLSLPSMPPLSSSDGGWPEATEAAARIRSVTGDQPTAVTGSSKVVPH